jgi:8-oxo-dGTP diphosphatase
VPGGAIQYGENAWQAALREVTEETGFDLSHAAELARHVEDHGGWSYTTIIAASEVVVHLDVIVIGEQQDLVWIPVPDVDTLPLHPGFGDSWPRVRSLVLAQVAT